MTCLIGQFVKDTEIEREQVFSEASNELIKDHQTLKTSPSAIFILILDNHRLLYFNETSYAPSLHQFQVTISKFLKAKHLEYINEMYEERLSLDQKTTKKALKKEVQTPSLHIIPLTKNESISELIEQYAKLNSAEIEFIATNNELDNNDLFDQVKKSQEEARSTKTTIRHQNRGDGLFRRAVIRQVQSATQQGNAAIKLKGRDEDGNKIEVTNEQFKIKTMLTEIPSTMTGISRACLRKFTSLVDSGAIFLGERAENISEKLEDIISKHHNQ